MIPAIEAALQALVSAALTPEEEDPVTVLLNDPRIDDLPEPGTPDHEALRAAVTTQKPVILDTLSAPGGVLHELELTLVVTFQAMGDGAQARVRDAAATTSAALEADVTLGGAASWARVVESGGQRERINGAPDDNVHELMVKALFYSQNPSGF